ncbi:MAG: hypothetical protein V9H25_20095 [Candidatus Competibacter sp.]|jgi:hypothetical protein
MSIKELKLAVSKLPSKKMTRFFQFFEKVMADQWDCQIEDDILVRRLDPAGKRADEAFEG